MKLKKIINFRSVLLLVLIIFSIMAINYNPFASGIKIKHVDGITAEQGLKQGMKIYSVNGVDVNTIQEFNNALDKAYKSKETNLTIETDNGTYAYAAKKLGFEVLNLTATKTETDVPIKEGMKILKFNGKEAKDDAEFYGFANEILPKNKYIIKTDKGEFAFLTYDKPSITAKEASKSNIRMGLDLEGGTRVLLQPKSDAEITDRQISDLISVLSNRLDVYGLTDMKIRAAKDFAGNKFVLVEISGVTKEEVTSMIAQQGVFEAKIGDETVFEGGKKDITFVCKGDGSCSGVRDCFDVEQNQASCRFEFAIHLSPDAAKKHSKITEKLDINSSEGREQYLSKNLDFYLDEKLVDSLRISADLKGKETTAIAISGPGYGTTQEEAYKSAIKGMERLQTILITGSLPLKLEIIKIDTLSPTLGKEFIKNALLAGIVALICVTLVVFARYRKLKVVLPIIFIGSSEILLTLGLCGFLAETLGWSLDLVSIAGIIAAVGTGVNDQIIVIDELLKKGKEDEMLNLKEKVKKAFFIVFAACATIIVAMIPLLTAGAGLIRGFAITTIIGVLIGVLITRPVFAHIVRVLLEEE